MLQVLLLKLTLMISGDFLWLVAAPLPETPGEIHGPPLEGDDSKTNSPSLRPGSITHWLLDFGLNT